MFRLRHRAGWKEELYVTCAPVLFFQVYLIGSHVLIYYPQECYIIPRLFGQTNTGFRLCNMIIAREGEIRKGPTPLLLCAGWFIGRGVKHGISGASGECGAVHLFNVPSMTTGDRENSRVFFQLFSSILPEQY